MKLGLGTVQWGIDYGISNPEGRTPEHEVRRILELAQNAGVELLDTAPGYGIAEEVLGRQMGTKRKFRVVSKIPRTLEMRSTDEKVRTVQASFKGSLKRLGCESIYGLLFHHADDVLAQDGLAVIQTVQKLKASGRVLKIGVSVYNGDQIDRVLDRFPIDLVQLPIHVFDQRLIRSGHLKKLKSRGVEIHARSVFFQGLVFMNPGELPSFFDPIKPRLRALQDLAVKRHVSMHSLALTFARSVSELEVILCGVNHATQFEETLEIWNKGVKELSDIHFEGFACEDESVLNPAKWPGRT